MKTNLLVFSIIASLLIGGCISTKPSTSYLLRHDEKAERQYRNTVVIDSVQLAGYLEQASPVRRMGKHKVDIFADMVWAQDFRSMVKETLEGNLLLRNANSKDARVFHAIVSFLRFEIDESAGKLVVSAVCFMRCGKESMKRQFALEYDSSGCTGDKLIDLYDKALSELSDKLCEMAESQAK